MFEDVIAIIILSAMLLSLLMLDYNECHAHIFNKNIGEIISWEEERCTFYVITTKEIVFEGKNG